MLEIWRSIVERWSSLFLIVLLYQLSRTNAQNVSSTTEIISNATTIASITDTTSNASVASTGTSEVVDLFQSNHSPNLTCDGVFAFERTLDSAVSPALILNEANRTQSLSAGANGSLSELTFPCYRMCIAAEHCVAYIVDYNNARCLLLYQRPKQSRAELVPLAGLAYYEKICLKVPDLKCSKEWAFERVVGMELADNDDLVLKKVRNRVECMTACLQETMFVCRSAEFNYQTNNCNLSKQSRRTLPNSFRSTQEPVDYLENQCAQEPQICDFRAIEEHMFSVETELENATSLQECQNQCKNQENYVCRSYRFDEVTRQCLLSADDRASSRVNTDQSPQSLFGFMERGECVDISMTCGPVSMTAVLKLNRPFNGRFYPADKPNQCVVVGNNDFEVQLALSLEGDECGTKSMGNGTFYNDVVVQMHPVVLRDSDRRIRIACDYPSSKVTLTDDLTIEGLPPRFLDPNLANNTQVVSGIAALPKVRLQIRNGVGREVQGAQLGDPLILSIDMLDEGSAFGISASDLVAMSGAGDETLQLLDGKGCPVEPSIFPSLSKVNSGRSLTSRFAAFKFASDSIVKFRVTVSFCLDSCPMPDCGSGTLLRKRRDVSNSSAIEEQRELTMELAILVDTDSNKAPTIGKDGVINEAQAQRLKSLVCTRGSLIWGLGITAAIIQVITLSSCVAFITMYRRLKHQKGDLFGSPSTSTQTMAWSEASTAATKNPDLYRMYK